MDHFYVIKIRNALRWGIVIILAFATALFLWIGNNNFLSVFSKKLRRQSREGIKSSSNYPSFNISWGEKKVHDILDQLKEHQSTSYLFKRGWAGAIRRLSEKISEGNHEIGMLGYRYKSYLKQEKDQVRKDLLYAEEIFRKLGYEDIHLVRPPSGQFNKEILELTEGLGFQVIHWNVNPNDWANPGTQTIIDKVIKETDNGDIILLHASDSVKQTADALSTILPAA